jgi:hypothetical protein
MACGFRCRSVSARTAPASRFRDEFRPPSFPWSRART